MAMAWDGDAVARGLSANAPAPTLPPPEPKICEPGGSGMFVPLFGGDDEGNWSYALRAILYGIVMCYCFLGAAIVSDFFMAAIEAITSQKGRRVVDKEKKNVVTYFVWNDTVANLTLLALGSSAPEILLSVVEVMKLGFKAGDLGPGTIVGSAAFNMMCIISVAILAIPAGEVRYIKGICVYHVTVVFCLVAYLWLLFIVAISSPDVVEVWESISTLFLFFLLVVLAFLTDKYEGKKQDDLDHQILVKEAQQEALRLSSGDVDDEDGHHVSKKKVRKLLSPHLRLVNLHHQCVLHKTHNRMSVAFKKGIPDGAHMMAGGLSETVAAIVAKSPPAGDNGDHILDDTGQPIINQHGVLTFICDQLEVKGSPTDSVIAIPVLRRNGVRGHVSCKYRVERLDAVPDCDYEETEGVLDFPAGSCLQELQLTIMAQRATEPTESFQLILEDAEGDAEFNPNDDGGELSSIMTIHIVNGLDEDVKIGLGIKIYNALVDPELTKYGMQMWKEQIAEACKANPDSDEAPSLSDNIMHAISFPWKLVFAIFSPPSIFLGGWVLFVVALVFVGGLTAFISDLAETFGCCMGFANAVTAIIVVAPGTSLPDLFASQAAAIADENADASIVNVTGSNSVNVFLGIGLPWTMATLYWQIKGEVGANEKFMAKYPDFAKDWPNGAFVVEAGTLGFSVIIFVCVSIICLGSLRIKRHLDGGELGGDNMLRKQGCAGMFTFLWVWYIAWSILKSSTDAADAAIPISIAFAFIFTGMVALLEFMTKTGKWKSKCPTGLKQLQAAGGNGEGPNQPLMSVEAMQARLQSQATKKTEGSPSVSNATADESVGTEEPSQIGKASDQGDSNGDENGDPSAKCAPKKKKKPSNGPAQADSKGSDPKAKAKTSAKAKAGKASEMKNQK